ncbi:MAG: TIGR01777 family oxidoreductase [Crocinitomicaceae bacterium]
MNILIAGGTGLIGQRLTDMLVNNGHTVHILSRQKRTNKKFVKYFEWTVGEYIDQKAFFNQDSKTVVDGIINLTGAGIADKRWTSGRKKEIISSRVRPAQFIQNTLLDLKVQVPVYISASGVNYYNNSKAKHYKEADNVGDGFVQHVCKLWEEQAFNMKNVASRISVIRTGVVLAKKKSFLQKFTATIKIGVAGIFGSGHQFLSWIHIDDLCHFYIHAIENKNINGSYNAGICNEDTHLSFLKAYRNTTKKKFIILKAPNLIAKLVFGEMAILLTEGVSVSHQKMLESEFRPEFTTVEKALENLY